MIESKRYVKRVKEKEKKITISLDSSDRKHCFVSKFKVGFVVLFCFAN